MAEEIFLDDADRYARLRLIRWWDQDRLRRAKIVVVGAGAIGNEVLKNLALLGVGQVWVVDFDRVEASNLARSVLFREADRGRSKAEVAARAMREINPDVQVHAIDGNVVTDVGLGLFRDANLVIGCLDNREARLWVNRCCWKVGTPWIDGGIEEINGVVKVFVPPDGACYECGMTENDYRLINLRYSCPQLRREEMHAGKVPTSPTIASMVGGLQVQEALKLLHELPVDAGHALVWNGVASSFYKTAYQRREDCLSHETYSEPIELPWAAQHATAHDLFNAVTEELGSDGECRILLDRDLVTAFECTCGHSWPVLRSQFLVEQADAKCLRCDQVAKPRMVHSVESGSPLAGEKLCSLGIPKYDIVCVANERTEVAILLAGDREVAD